MFSGCVRMLAGLSIALVTLVIGERNAEQGLIIGRWYDEALLTGVAQVARGGIEAFAPYGRTINLSLDVVGTVVNLATEFMTISARECPSIVSHYHAYPDPSYPFPFQLLYLV